MLASAQLRCATNARASLKTSGVESRAALSALPASPVTLGRWPLPAPSRRAARGRRWAPVRDHELTARSVPSGFPASSRPSCHGSSHSAAFCYLSGRVCAILARGDDTVVQPGACAYVSERSITPVATMAARLPSCKARLRCLRSGGQAGSITPDNTLRNAWETPAATNCGFAPTPWLDCAAQRTPSAAAAG